MQIRKLSDHFSVSPQIAATDLTAIRAADFDLVINNRPDGEEPGQPANADLAQAATDAGLDYADIPVSGTGATLADVSALADKMAAGGRILAFCRSGARSTMLWALASAKNGVDADTIIASARAAGQDLAMLRPTLEQLAKQG